ncbi:hypothetical protein [Planctomicrobium piriforme]|nr:hypothetical protein [Planctomicrobium piriforme]
MVANDIDGNEYILDWVETIRQDDHPGKLLKASSIVIFRDSMGRVIGVELIEPDVFALCESGRTIYFTSGDNPSAWM